MRDSEQEIDEMPPPQIKRGRPTGKSDSTQRTRRTAQEISDDKIRIAQMKLDALKESEEKKLSNKRTRARVPKQTPIVQEIAMPVRQSKPRQDSSSPSPKHTYTSKKQALYDSFLNHQEDINI